MNVIARPEYRVLVPGQQHFDCVALRASLSTSACADRWQVAPTGSACSGCAMGRLHHADHHPTQTMYKRSEDVACLRCGRADLRIIRSTGLCISCWNRTREKMIGRNGRGTAPVKLQLWDTEVAIQYLDGRVERRLIPVANQAEALARVLRAMPEGAKLLVGERRLTVWNPQIRQFELVCNHCETPGLILERERDGVLQRHAWCCGGEPKGSGWEHAKIRRPLLALSAEIVETYLSSAPDLADEQFGVWTPTAYACPCGAGQIEGLRTTSDGTWKTKCRSCGAKGN